MVMELNAATLVSISLVSLALLVSLLSRKKRHQQPPGPRCLPFVGNLLHLLTSEPQVALRDLAKKHGPVMYLRLGHVDTVVVSSPATAQEVLQDSSVNFASRPKLLSPEIMCYENTDIAFSPYGAYWRTLRKLCAVELLSARKVRHFAAIRDRETLAIVASATAATAAGKTVNLAHLLLTCSNEITAKAAFGEGCGAELREQFLSAMELALMLGGGFCFADLFPSLQFVDAVTGMRRRLWQGRRQLDAIFDTMIADCQARREEKKKTAATDREDDLLSVILRIKDEGDLEFPIGTKNIKAIIIDLFTGGTDTTASTVEWIMSELMRHPEVLAKVQEEVRRTLDNKRPEDHESHMHELGYMKLVIKEGLRLHPALPLLLPRVCRETCDIGGFKVLEGTRVMVNVWAIGRDPELWQDAEVFRPERFEDSVADFKGMQFEYLPFGSGRRMCPGNTFGLAMVELMLARVLYYFDWKLPAAVRVDELDMGTVVGITMKRRSPLHLVATPYNVPPMGI